MVLIKNGMVIDPEKLDMQPFDVILDHGVIAGIGFYEDNGAYETVIDAAGCAVAPGLVDVHVHFRDPGLTYKEDIRTGAAAAAAGGYTTVVCMANTKPPVDNAETLRYVTGEGEKTGIHVLAAAAVSVGMKGQELTDMRALAAAGAAGFTDDGIPLMNESLVREAMMLAAELNRPLSFHEEDPAFIGNNGINHGAVSEQLGICGSPAVAEDSLVARDCMIALDVSRGHRPGTPAGNSAAAGASAPISAASLSHAPAPADAIANIQHISSRTAVEQVRLAKRLGARVCAEVTPHHFTLTEEAVLKYGTLAKMNPPLRTERDRQALIAALQDGTIDIIATDHAPHSAEEKSRPLTEAPSGIIGLETALALGITELVEKRYLTLPELMAKMSLNPARLYRLDCGRMQTGAPADLVIFSPDEAWTVSEFRSRSANSPFVGRKLRGKVKYTICGGRLVYQDGAAGKTARKHLQNGKIHVQ